MSLQLAPRAPLIDGTDPYDPEEPIPASSKAIDSSCWELSAYQKHYLAPVSTLGKIFAETFTKQPFNMEDFLDHGYSTVSQSHGDGRDQC